MIDTVKRVHVEASGRCNSRCPMCSRFTSTGFLQPNLIEKDLDEKIFYKLFTSNFCKNLEHVYFSGVYGDPCLNEKLPDFINWLQQHNVDLSIDTNAGYRTKKWWEKLGKYKPRVHFAIDGLEDTNHLYRRGVKWKKVMDNVKAFQEAGGNGAWTFIVFKHNEHQVEEARKIAENMGMDFRLKITQKFKKFKFWNVLEDGKYLYKLHPPDINTYRHSNVGNEIHDPKNDYFTFTLDKYNHLDNIEIDCEIKKKDELYLSFEGYLLPCCFLATLYHDSPGSFQFNKLFNKNDYNLHLLSVEQAKQNLMKISKSWQKNKIIEGKLLTCTYTCGKPFSNKTQYGK